MAVTHPTLDSPLHGYSTEQLQLKKSNMHNCHAKKEKEDCVWPQNFSFTQGICKVHHHTKPQGGEQAGALAEGLPMFGALQALYLVWLCW